MEYDEFQKRAWKWVAIIMVPSAFIGTLYAGDDEDSMTILTTVIIGILWILIFLFIGIPKILNYMRTEEK